MNYWNVEKWIIEKLAHGMENNSCKMEMENENVKWTMQYEIEAW